MRDRSLLNLILEQLSWFQKELFEFVVFLRKYLQAKTMFLTRNFERNKNVMVKSILLKRGKLNRMFLHVSAMVILTIGIILSPYLSESNPFSDNTTTLTFAQEFNTAATALSSDDVFQTARSEKPRDKVLEYTVQKGDTVSTIGKKFGISADTLKWANDLKNDNITVGDTLKILPVTGIAHKVESGDTVYTIAKKYDTNPQAIVDFPFNDFANPQTFSLISGQILIVPEGIKPEEKPAYAPRRSYVATGPVTISGEGFTWPMRGSINQFYSWYHKALDIGGPVGTPIVAAHTGKVVGVYNGGWNGGYGVHVIVQGNNGFSSLYAHMSSTNVSLGDTVTAGSSTLGWVGMTGRTTGPHLHFEIRGAGLLNPLSYLK